MQVTRDFDAVYASEADPWQIGTADSERYDLYRHLVLRHATGRERILDIGCGFGAFLARFRGQFRELIGVDVSTEATAKGRARHPEINYLCGSATDLEALFENTERFDVIIYSDVVCYFDETAKRRSLRWIRDHLRQGGLAFVAAWCPGGKYLTPDELSRLCARYFHIEAEQVLDSGHAVFLCRRAERLAAVTIDYETWQPLPPGETIDWKRTVFDPAESLMHAAEAASVPLTFMAEMGEYFWLVEYDAGVARQMEAQWRDAVRRGHDVQLHLHPSWLPELGARRHGNRWTWDFSKAKAADYPGDLRELIGRCRSALERILCEGRDDYRVRCFRAGTYQAQPFDRLYDALSAHGIDCDSSVYSGGHSAERGYDYRLAYSTHAPYFANRFDPQLKAPPSERAIVELPIFTLEPGERWFLDGAEGPRLADRLLDHLERREEGPLPSEAYRVGRGVQKRALRLYAHLRRRGRWAQRLLPRRLAHALMDYPREQLVANDYFVMIGHTKGPHAFDAIRDGLSRVAREGNVRFVTLREMAERARMELASSMSRDSRAEATYQVRRETAAVMGDERNEAQSLRAQEMIPWDREVVLDLGCGAGHWSERIARTYPWMRVVGLDYGRPFLQKAANGATTGRTSFAIASFDALPIHDGSVDCVYADNSLEHAFDIDRTLHEVRRILRDGGVLVAAVPSDARNPDRTCDNHTWKTAPHEVRLRLRAAGFLDAEITEVDTFRELGMSPFPPSDDRMMYVRAWKRAAPVTQFERALDAMRWVYERLDPARGSEGIDAVRILERGHAWCEGYAIALGSLLAHEGFRVRWVSMIAHDHPRGTGPEKRESHEVIIVDLDGRECLLDPMSNTAFPHALSALLSNPEFAKGPEQPDARWRDRSYHLYSTAEWYGRVTRYAVRSDVRRRHRWIDAAHSNRRARRAR